MIRFQPITISGVQYYKFMEGLLAESFPLEECHELKHLREYTDRTGNSHNNIILDDDLSIDFITYWGSDEFYCVEHFITNPALRNGGYGRRTLEYLCEFLKRSIVLEIERPAEEMAKRRINSYQRYGFILREKDYYQPPYKEGDDFLPIYPMVHGNLNTEKDYEGVKHKLRIIAYGVKE